MTFKEILAETISARILEREPNTPKNETAGFYTAYRAWNESNATHSPDAKWQNYNADTVILDSYLNSGFEPKQATDFLTTLRDNGVTYIFITDTSTALMQTIHALCNAGAELAGTAEVKRKRQYGEVEPRQKQAIVLTVPTAEAQGTPDGQTADKPNRKTRRG